jgi:hypothetical protein
MQHNFSDYSPVLQLTEQLSITVTFLDVLPVVLKTKYCETHPCAFCQLFMHIFNTFISQLLFEISCQGTSPSSTFTLLLVPSCQSPGILLWFQLPVLWQLLRFLCSFLQLILRRKDIAHAKFLVHTFYSHSENAVPHT